MAASKGLEKRKPPVVTQTGLVRIENAHMEQQMTPDGKVILEKFRHLYPDEVSESTGRQFAERFPQSITVGRDATYFIPKGRFATLRGALFSFPRKTLASIRQEISSADLHNRVHHNRTWPGCMNESWDLEKKREKENARYAAARTQAKKR